MSRRSLSSLLSAIAVVHLLACNGNTVESPARTSSDAGSTAAQKYCSSYCDWKSRCSKSDSSCSSGSCVTEAESASRWRASYVDGVAGCFASLSCEENDDRCLSDFTFGEPSYPNVQYIQDCLSKRTACESAFADDWCLSLAALTDAARTEASACNAKPCDQVRDCLKAAGAFSD